MGGRESPNHTPEGQPPLYIGVIGNIIIVIKGDELMISYLPKYEKCCHNENHTHDEG
jgi:hypothetical protein